MPSKLALLGASSVAVGAAGTSAYALYNNSQNSKKLKDLFDVTKGRILLEVTGDKHDSVWEQILAEHGKSNHKISGVNSKATLKDYCKKLGDSFNAKDLEAYSNWCSRNTLRTQITGSNKRWNDSLEDSAWEVGKDSYSKETTDNFLITKDGGTQSIAKNALTAKELREWCFNKSELPFINVQDKDYLIADKFCTVAQ
ncbi:hypothetical protein HF1_05960 [Mycoplasma haemofelis str. Langford 1]|uniref:Lipoprotein n=2 Tax=Mycoplasma haemofelis TaxID=29501 RepID=F6FI70_MYCHI|nr:hypothetical protein [Mycoplasma haemofelis]AEG72918.1 hypothetical protein MHF_0646 [Mycoplasma haemofelis Ohio2]CBY92604.1 hypothetical protein HF1_05960 [Mycoplasma haemofelis str. Langford 1]